MHLQLSTKVNHISTKYSNKFLNNLLEICLNNIIIKGG